MTSASRISAYLILASDSLDFAECTAAVGLEPTDTWVKKVKHPDLPNKEWSFGFKKREFDSIGDALAELVRMLAGHESQIRSFAKKSGCSVSVICNVTIREDPPLYEIGEGQLLAMSQLGADFGMDIIDQSD